MRKQLKNKRRVVIKVGSSSLTTGETGRIDLIKLEVLVRELSDMRNHGIDVVLVTSGAIQVGRVALGFRNRKPHRIEEKQACAAVGQLRLMMMYQKLFGEYNQIAAQVLLTKTNMTERQSRRNARATFSELLELSVIPVVNENDTVATAEIEAVPVFGDNDTLAASVAELIGADLLILLSDIDGLYTGDPHTDGSAQFIAEVDALNDELMAMGKSTTGSGAGTGGMATKLAAARIAMDAACDMLIASGDDFHIIHRLLEGEEIGTFFRANGGNNPVA